MNECMKQFVEAVKSGQIDPNMTVGQLAQQLEQQSQGQQGQPQASTDQGLGQIQG